jgi:hypothetical protein
MNLAQRKSVRMKPSREGYVASTTHELYLIAMALLLHLRGPFISFLQPPPSPPPAREAFVQKWNEARHKRCATNAEGQAVLTSKYFAKEAAWFTVPGEGTICGTTPGDYVSLFPVSNYAAERVAVLFGASDGGYVPAAAIFAAQKVTFSRTSERFEATIRRQRVERDGTFTFPCLPAGRYYIISQSSPHHYALREGYAGLVCRLVEVSEHGRKHIRLAPTESERATDFAPLEPIELISEDSPPSRKQAAKALWAICRHSDLRLIAMMEQVVTPSDAGAKFGSPDRADIFRHTCKHMAPAIMHRTEHLGPLDVELVARWANLSPPDTSTPDYLVGRLGIHEANRLTSARQAEIAARKYFESSQMVTEDVSLHQATMRSREWITHDLEAGGVKYDVKNARRSHASPRSYSEFIVPKFKRTRHGSEDSDVRLLAVLSHYTPASAFLDPCHVGSANILGETTAAAIAEANALAHEWTGGALTISRETRDALLPGWFFEYPTWAYEARRCAMSRLGPALDAILDWHIALDSLPAVLLILGGRADPARFAIGSAEHRLLYLHQQSALTRLTLGAWALSELIRAARNVPGADPTRLSELLFDGGGEIPRSLPGLLCDSEEFIASLLKAIDDTWRAAGEKLRKFTQFQLAGSGIFRARTGGGPWQTIFSHCGGRDSRTKGKCGQSPLVLGVQQNCARCGKLICHVCGYCARECSDEGAEAVGTE